MWTHAERYILLLFVHQKACLTVALHSNETNLNLNHGFLHYYYIAILRDLNATFKLWQALISSRIYEYGAHTNRGKHYYRKLITYRQKKTFNVLYFQYEIYIPLRCNKIWKYNLNGRKINFINNIYRHQYNVMF